MQWKKLKNLMVKTAAIFAFCGALCTAGSKMPFIKQAQAEEVLATSALPFEKAELLPSTTAEGGLSDALAENQEKYLYSRIGLQKDGVSVRDITKGSTDKHRSRVVVIDSGVKYDHEDFLGEDGSIRFSPLSYNVTMKKTVEEGGYEILADSEIVNGHGTQVCGQIFAVGDNGVGIAGLAEDVELIFVKVTPTSGGGYDGYEMLEAMEYAATLNADVVNMSLGNFLSSNPYTSVLRRIRNSGAVIVSAAGNVSQSDLHYPSADSSVVGVGAFANLLNYGASATEYAMASYSTFGDKNVQICAPGGFYTTTMDGGYAYGNGTSLATPIVTAAVALYRSLYPESTVDEVETALFASANDQGDRGKDYQFGYGGLNVYDFLFGEKGTVTFDYGTGKTETRTVSKGKALQDYPFPVAADIPTGKGFGGWYLDPAHTRPLTYYKEVLPIGATVYAKWQAIGADGLSSGNAVDYGALDYTFTKNGTIAIKGYYGGDTRLILPSVLTVNGTEYTVTDIAARAFQRHKTLQKIVLPTTVSTVREYAFAGDYEYVYLPSSVTTVQKHSFNGAATCLYLQSESEPTGFTSGWDTNAELTTVLGVAQVKVQGGMELVLKDGAYTLLSYDGKAKTLSLTAEYPITEIAPSAFENNTYIQSVYAPDAVTVGERAFYGCSALTDARFDKAESFGSLAFYACSALTEMRFPQTLREIGDSAFARNTALIRFTIPEESALERIGDYAFDGCTSLECVDLGGAQTLSYVGANAFNGAKNVFVVYLPDSVQTVGYNAFGGLQSLRAARLPFLGRGRTDTYTHFGYAFGASNIDLQGSVLLDNLQYLFIGGDVKDGAFKGISGLSVFAEGSCSAVDGCTVYANGEYALVKMYADGILAGLIGGAENSAIAAAELETAYRMPKGSIFSGWSADVSVFPAAGEHSWTVTTETENYEIVFQGESGEVLSKQTLAFGEKPAEPAAPAKASTAQYDYVFIGWGKPVAPACESAVYVATYQAVERSYTVSFYNGGELIAQGVYAYGETPLVPTVQDRPINETYYEKFVGWDNEIAAVDGNAEYHACFEKDYVLYVVQFLYENGEVFCEQSYRYGEEILPPNTDRVSDAQYDYAFIGWTAEFVAVTQDAAYTATYQKTLREYTVRFVNYDGEELSAEPYTYGEMPTPPTDPQRADEDGYRFEFIGWDTDVTAVSGDKTYTAVYKAVSTKIVVRFVNYDGALLTETEYEKGAAVTPPDAPQRTVDSKSYYYEFSGWDKDVAPATENVTYKATFERKYYEYTVSFMDFDGEVLSEKTYRYGAAVEAPANPVREGYTFLGWDKELVKVEGNAVYTATYERVAGSESSDSSSSSEESSESPEIPESSSSSEVSEEESNSSSEQESSSSLESAESESFSAMDSEVSSSSSTSSAAAGNAKKGGCGGTVGAFRGILLTVCVLAVVLSVYLAKKEKQNRA